MLCFFFPADTSSPPFSVDVYTKILALLVNQAVTAAHHRLVRRTPQGQYHAPRGRGSDNLLYEGICDKSRFFLSGIVVM